MKLYNWIFYILGVCLLSSCMDDELGDRSKVQEGLPATLSLSVIAPEAEVVTKAINANDINTVNDLYIMIFNEAGTRIPLTTFYFTKDALKSPLKIRTTSGKRYICAVANVKDANTEDVYDQLQDVEKLDDLKNLSVKLKDDNKGTTLNEGIVLMTGGYFGTGDAAQASLDMIPSETIDVQPESTTELTPCKLYLRRVISGVNVKFVVPGYYTDQSKTTTPVTFEMTSYQIMNLPANTSLYAQSSATDGTVFSSGIEKDMTQTVEKVEIESEPYKKQTFDFSFFMLENTQEDKSDLKDWVDREKRGDDTGWDPTGSNLGQFKNAPLHSTYLIIKGHYQGKADIPNSVGVKDVDADVTYYVHLGYVNGAKDFSLFRNTTYRYTLTLEKIDKIAAEATAIGEDYPRGDGILNYAQTIIPIDAQFGAYALYLKASTNYRVSFEGGNLAQRGGWVKYKQGGKKKDTNILGFPKFNNNYVCLTEPINTLDELKTAEDAIVTAGNTGGWYSFFFNENYDTDDNWTEYVNQPDRIFRLTVVDDDSPLYNGSKLVSSELIVRQKSIKTIYNHSDNNEVAYGVETISDSHVNQSYEVPEKSSASTFLTTFWGEDNTATELAWLSVTWPEVYDGAYSTSAVSACLARNNISINTSVTKESMHWYLPSLKQMAGLILGSAALGNSKLYPYATTASLGKDGNKDKARDINGIFVYRSPANQANEDAIKNYHSFWTNSGETNGKYYFSAEEGGTMNTQEVAGKQNINVRCVRTLGKRQNTPGEGEFYTLSGRTFNLDKLLPEAIRPNYYKELPRHTEADEMDLLPRKFEVASADLSGTYDWLEVNNSLDADPSKSPCRTFDGSSDWRLPNHREIMLMAVEQLSNPKAQLLDSSKEYMSRTRFSNAAYRQGYGVNKGLLKLYDSVDRYDYPETILGLKNRTFSIRCVRDVK